jgi:hypothetical protein
VHGVVHRFNGLFQVLAVDGGESRF